MGMARCAECGGFVSTNTRTCPHCGYTPRSGDHCVYCVHYDGEESECAYGGGNYDVCPAYVYDDNSD